MQTEMSVARFERSAPPVVDFVTIPEFPFEVLGRVLVGTYQIRFLLMVPRPRDIPRHEAKAGI